MSNPPHEQPSADGRRLRVLLIDDDELVLRATARMLRRELDVVTAISSDSALALFSDGQEFDVVIADLSLPGLNGVGLLERARRDWPMACGRLGVLSGREPTAEERRSLLALDSSVLLLEKPVPKGELLRCLQLAPRAA